MRHNIHIPNFGSGELSPELSERTDIDQYGSGLSEVTNFIIDKRGGLLRRSGLEYIEDMTTVGQILGINYNKAIIPFQTENEDYSIIITLNNGRFMLGLQPSDDCVIIKKDNGTIVPIRCLTDTVGSNPDYRIGTQFYSNLDPLGFRWVQIGEEIFVTHSSGKLVPFAITYTETLSGVEFTCEDLVYKLGYGLAIVDQYRAMLNANPITDYYDTTAPNGIEFLVALSGVGTAGQVATGPSLIDVVPAVNASPYPYFEDKHIGTIYYTNNANAAEGAILITEIVSPVLARGTAILVHTAPISVGRYNATSSWNHDSGFPKTIAAHNNRLIFGNTDREPNAFWASYVGNYRVFRNRTFQQDASASADNSNTSQNISGGVKLWGELTDAFAFRNRITVPRLSTIQWLQSDLEGLRIGTLSGDGILTSLENKFSALGVLAFNQTSGTVCKNFPVILADDKLCYLASEGRAIRMIDTKSGDYAYRNIELSILAEHLREYGSSRNYDTNFTKMVWQPDMNILWVINSQGMLLSATVNQASGAIGFAKHDLFGVSRVNDILVKRTSLDSTNAYRLYLVASMDNADSLANTNEYVYMGLSQIHYEDSYTWELLNPDPFEVIPRYLDCHKVVIAATHLDPPTNTAVVAHLPNETVTVRMDNGTEEKVMTDGTGTFTTVTPFRSAVVGIPYKSRAKSLKLEGGQQFGTSRGNRARVDRIILSVRRSLGGVFGSPNSRLVDIEYRDNSQLYTGDIVSSFPDSTDNSIEYIIETENSLPLNVLGITFRGVTYDQ